MSQVKLVKLRLIPGNEQIRFDRCEELKHRKDEVIETLRNEGVISESCFFSEDEQCIYYFMEAKNLEHAKSAIERKPYPIDLTHKEKRTLCLEKVGPLTELFHFENR